MMMKFMDTTHVNPIRGEKFVFKDGLDLVVKFNVPQGMTPSRDSPVIRKVKEFACRTGTAKINAMCIAKKLIIQTQDTLATQMVTRRVCKAGLVHLVIAHKRMIQLEVTSVMSPLE